MKKETGSMTISYAFIQATFWMSFCICINYAANYLLGLGYSNTELGMITALGNLLGAVFAPAICSKIDQDARFSASRVTPPVLLAQALMLLLLTLFPVRGVVTTIVYMVYMMFATSVNSLNLKLYADAEHASLPLSYSPARGMGSFGFMVLAFFLGGLIERNSIHVLPRVGLLISGFQFLAFYLFARRLPKGVQGTSTDIAKSGSLIQFLRQYKRFSLMLVGCVLLFFAHNTACNFLINVTRNVGGDSGTMGFISAFMAMTELPVMFLFTRFLGKRNMGKILIFAYVIFTVKAVAFALAPTVPTLTASFLLQAPSYALYTAAIVPYVGKIVSYEDSAKAQSLAYTTTTVGSVLANIVAGRLYDVISVTQTLWIAVAVSIVGTLVAVLGVEKATSPAC